MAEAFPVTTYDRLMVANFLHFAHRYGVELPEDKLADLAVIAGGTLPEAQEPYYPGTRHDGPCERCERYFPEYDQHHIIKKERGGNGTRVNLRTICKLCHNELHELERDGRFGVVDDWWQLQVRRIVHRDSLGTCFTKGASGNVPLAYYLPELRGPAAVREPPASG